LTTPKNALIKQYQRMFVLDGVQLEFEQQALEEIASLAEVRQTGARGLRAILEEVLGPVMFEVPSTDQVDRVIITKDAVQKISPPIIVLKTPARREKSA
jgi:ATP-dependent Clp protease ATP-binding subunit ClpX